MAAQASGRLKGTRVLIVEDNYLVAFDLAGSLEDLEATVLGPASRASDALALLERETPDGAILDVNLFDGVVTPVAEKLIGQHVPLIFCTGTGVPTELEKLYPDLTVYLKPTAPEHLARKLADMLERRP